MGRPIYCLLLALAALAAPARGADSPIGGDRSWVDPMHRVHARFTGRRGTFAQFGDSITVSMAYWAPLRHRPRGMSPQAEQAYDLVRAYMLPECWDRWKGPEYGSDGSRTIRWADQSRAFISSAMAGGFSSQ